MALEADSNWDYYRELTISDTASNSAYFNFSLWIYDDDAGADDVSNGHIDTGGYCNDFPEDLRFGTTNDASTATQLKQWFQVSGSTSSQIWIKLPAGGADTIYMFVGNNSVTYSSNIGNTFLMGDDFNDYGWVTGESLGASGGNPSFYEPISGVIYGFSDESKNIMKKSTDSGSHWSSELSEMHYTSFTGYADLCRIPGTSRLLTVKTAYGASSFEWQQFDTNTDQFVDRSSCYGSVNTSSKAGYDIGCKAATSSNWFVFTCSDNSPIITYWATCDSGATWTEGRDSIVSENKYGASENNEDVNVSLISSNKVLLVGWEMEDNDGSDENRCMYCEISGMATRGGGVGAPGSSLILHSGQGAPGTLDSDTKYGIKAVGPSGDMEPPHFLEFDDGEIWNIYAGSYGVNTKKNYRGCKSIYMRSSMNYGLTWNGGYKEIKIGHFGEPTAVERFTGGDCIFMRGNYPNVGGNNYIGTCIIPISNINNNILESEKWQRVNADSYQANNNCHWEGLYNISSTSFRGKIMKIVGNSKTASNFDDSAKGSSQLYTRNQPNDSGDYRVDTVIQPHNNHLESQILLRYTNKSGHYMVRTVEGTGGAGNYSSNIYNISSGKTLLDSKSITGWSDDWLDVSCRIYKSGAGIKIETYFSGQLVNDYYSTDVYWNNGHAGIGASYTADTGPVKFDEFRVMPYYSSSGLPDWNTAGSWTATTGGGTPTQPVITIGSGVTASGSNYLTLSAKVTDSSGTAWFYWSSSGDTPSTHNAGTKYSGNYFTYNATGLDSITEYKYKTYISSNGWGGGEDWSDSNSTGKTSRGVHLVEGDSLRIYISCNTYPNNKIDCWCKRWDEDNYNIVIETFLSSSGRNTLFSNITPGAVRELYNILGTPYNIDTTYESSNSLILEPLHGYGLSSVRQRRIVAVKNASDTFINPDYFNIKLELLRLDT